MGSINAMFIISLIIMAITAFIGYRKGLLMTLYSMVSIIFVVIFEFAFEPFIRQLLIKYLNLEVGVGEVVRQYVDARYEAGSFMHTALTAPDTMNSFVASLSKGVSVLMTFLVAVVISALIGIIVNKIGNINTWKDSNKIWGALVGILKGVVFVWVILYIGELISFSELGKTITTQANENAFLSIINELNILNRLLV